MRKKKGFFKKAFEYGMEKKKKYDEYQTKKLEDLSKRTMKEKEFLNKEINLEKLKLQREKIRKEKNKLRGNNFGFLNFNSDSIFDKPKKKKNKYI